MAEGEHQFLKHFSQHTQHQQQQQQSKSMSMGTPPQGSALEENILPYGVEFMNQINFIDFEKSENALVSRWEVPLFGLERSIIFPSAFIRIHSTPSPWLICRCCRLHLHSLAGLSDLRCGHTIMLINIRQPEQSESSASSPVEKC